MGTKNDPGQFDCYANAAPDEPMFILLARDPVAAELVREWAHQRQRLIELGAKPKSDETMIGEAMQCATAMDMWREANRPPLELDRPVVFRRVEINPPEEGWVIEHADSEVSRPMYWAGHNRWSDDHAAAVRFARQEDATAVAKCETPANSGQPHRACLHQWG